MGNEFSQEDYDNAALQMYQSALHHPCLLPDIGIDESLLKYSGVDSSAVLQAYSNDLATTVPGYIVRLGSTLAALNSVPNAVGLGALVLSMIMEICIKSIYQTKDNSYSMLRRVFGEEKASAVRDTMSECLKRHQTFVNNEQRLREEIQRLEAQLSNHLTILRNSLLHDGQMNTRGFKIWVNGASFHVQMLIHEARLNIQTGRPASEYVSAITVAISLYLQHLDRLLEKYKTFMTSITYVTLEPKCRYHDCYKDDCYLRNKENGCERNHGQFEPCSSSEMPEAYVKIVFSKYEPILGLKRHFLNISNNLNTLINQNDSFTLPQIT